MYCTVLYLVGGVVLPVPRHVLVRVAQQHRLAAASRSHLQAQHDLLLRTLSLYVSIS